MKSGNSCNEQYYERICRYYNLFIFGFVIMAVVFVMLRLARFDFIVPAIPYIGLIMSLSGALGLSIDKIVWQTKHKN